MKHILFNDVLSFIEDDEERDRIIKVFDYFKGYLLYIPVKPFEYKEQNEAIRDLQRLQTPKSELIQILSDEFYLSKKTIRRRLDKYKTGSLFEGLM